MASKEEILALLDRAKKYVSDYTRQEIIKKIYGIQDCCNSNHSKLIDLINSLITAIQYQVDLNIFDITTDTLYKALLELVGSGDGTTTPPVVVTVPLAWGYFNTDPLADIQAGNSVTYQFSKTIPVSETFEALDFTSGGSGKYLVVKQDSSDAVYTAWSFSPFNNGSFTNDSVFRDPLVVGNYRYYISRSSNGVFYELNNKFTITK